MPMRSLRFRPVLCAALLALALPASAQENKVLARVDGAPITEKDVSVALEDMGERLPRGLDDAQKRSYAIDFLIDLKIGARAAEAAKLGETPDFARRIAYYREKLLLDDFLMREGAKAITPEAGRKLYEETVKKIQPEPEARARHILVETEEEAKKVHARVTSGKEDFGKVAAEVSKDPGSKTEGGDLGFFTKERMVAPFAEVAFKLEAGQVSGPVKTQFGWHVIRLEEKRTKQPPAYEAVKDEIESYLMRQGQQNVIVGLREKAKIERLDKPAEAAPAEPKKP